MDTIAVVQESPVLLNRGRTVELAIELIENPQKAERSWLSFPRPSSPDTEEWINAGDSVVIAPGRKIVAGPMREEKGILFAEVDSASAVSAKRALDVAGHYSRPDIFSLHVNRQARKPVVFE